ncbi:MAG: alcohol dehydrogenase catalytic domain-containing protein [Nitrospirae bacterium]|nr:alcohol dehydrogenase catalytic domain-containing protein [Nitrospirota bacterium]
MKAVVLHKTGGVEGLHYETVPDPELRDDDVLVRIRACGVCYRDLLDRRGKFPFIQIPIITGHEFSGEVVKVGRNAGEWSPGDRVVNLHRNPCGFCGPCSIGDEIHCEHAHAHFGLTWPGGYAEYVAAPKTSLVRLPDSIPFTDGAVLMCTAAVALRAVKVRADVRLGEKVLITGASGGVGTMALQVAKQCGASVVAVTSSDGKKKHLEEMGADEVHVSPTGSFHKEIGGGPMGGVDVAVEIVGSATFNSSLRCLKPGGRLILVGNVTGERVELNPGIIILKALKIIGSDSCSRAELTETIRLVEAKKLRVHVSKSFPLSEAAKAQTWLEEKKSSGRTVLIPN